ncbi:hypothetical protein HYH03_006238 [Edaphochlamys debaryana]|uniref:Uncharacterized protein n=1 Tax=Edaphochlamys debaryana TaxID=47281 RepID=A0A835Y6I3_9CHLO|nr:hypothetical protein HYH03_006238 [Edaphochlamys debaryana]|eukprot:KAG2495638.1 hypothetical protein HYH03_006238 [Edaphochlamys debaryana]
MARKKRKPAATMSKISAEKQSQAGDEADVKRLSELAARLLRGTTGESVLSAAELTALCGQLTNLSDLVEASEKAGNVDARLLLLRRLALPVLQLTAWGARVRLQEAILAAFDAAPSDESDSPCRQSPSLAVAELARCGPRPSRLLLLLHELACNLPVGERAAAAGAAAPNGAAVFAAQGGRGGQDAAEEPFVDLLTQAASAFLPAYVDLYDVLDHFRHQAAAVPSSGGPEPPAPAPGPSQTAAAEAADRVEAALERVLYGSAAHYAVVLLGASSLCVADGQISYGLERVFRRLVSLACLPPFPSSEAASGSSAAPPDAAPDGGRTEMYHSLLFAFLHALAAPLPLRTPPLKARAAVALALRLGRVALASARGCGSRPPPSEPSPDDPSIVFPKDLAAVTINSVLSLCADVHAVPDPTSEAPMRPFRRSSWAREAEAAWRRWVDVVRWAVPCMEKEDVAQVVDFGLVLTSELLCELWDQGAGPLPAAVPPELSAPLRAGCLPALELVIRRAGEEPEGPYGAVLSALCSAPDHAFASLLRALLAYGEPRQGAALVSSMATVLRRTAANAASTPGAWRPGEHVGLASFDLTVRLLKDTARASKCGGLTAPERRLSLLLSLGAAEWLPPLGLLTRRVADWAVGSAVAGQASSSLAARLWANYCGRLLDGLLVWVAAATAAQPQPPGSAPGSGSCGPGPRLSAWQRFAVEEAGAVQLVGAALALAEGRAEAEAARAEAGTGSDGPRSSDDTDGGERYLLCPFLVAACCLSLARLVASRELLAAAGEGPRLPWRSQALRALRAEVESESKGEEDGAVCGAALAQLATGLARVSSGAEGLGVSTEALERGALAAGRVSEALSEPPALRPLAEARALWPPRACANPTCVSLAGDSAADAPPPRPAGLGGCCSAACAQELAGRRKAQ